MTTIAVDLDGVCYEWDKTARYMLRTYKGYDGLADESQDWDSIQRQVDPQDWRWLWSAGVDRGLFRYGHMVKDTRWGLERLASDGHSLVLVTHRPSHAVQDTVDWVSLYFKDIPITGLHILSNGEPKSTINADILIDDKPENIWEWTKVSRDAIIFSRPWNSTLLACLPHCSLPVEGQSGHKFRANGWRGVVYTMSVRRGVGAA